MFALHTHINRLNPAVTVPPAERVAAFFVLSYMVSLTAVIGISVWPRLDFVPSPENADKLYHAIAYAVIAGCAGLGFETLRGRIRASVLALVICGLLEIVQVYLPHRSGEFNDAIANATGILVGYGTAFLVMRALANSRYGRTME